MFDLQNCPIVSGMCCDHCSSINYTSCLKLSITTYIWGCRHSFCPCFKYPRSSGSYHQRLFWMDIGSLADLMHMAAEVSFSIPNILMALNTMYNQWHQYTIQKWLSGSKGQCHLWPMSPLANATFGHKSSIKPQVQSLLKFGSLGHQSILPGHQSVSLGNPSVSLNHQSVSLSHQSHIYKSKKSLNELDLHCCVKKTLAYSVV